MKSYSSLPFFLYNKSDITYEELTPSGIIFMVTNLHGSDITYEELTPGDYLHLIGYSVPSDITYEELTPINAWLNSYSSLLHVGHYL